MSRLANPLLRGFKSISKEIKICMISYSQYEDDSRIYRYARALIKKGYQVDMIGLGAVGQTKVDSFEGVTIYRLQTRDFGETTPFSYLWRLSCFFIKSSFYATKLYFKNKYDVIHYHNIPDGGVFCTLIPKLLGAKIILDIHDVVPEFYMRKFDVSESHLIIKFLKWVEKLSAHFVDHVITVTDIWKERLVQRSVRSEKCSVIMNVPDIELFRSEICPKKQNDDPFIFSYHGNLSETTGVETAMNAFAKGYSQMPNAILRIIGQGRNKEKYVQLIQQLKLDHAIQIHKMVPVKKVPQLLCEATVGLDPKEAGIYAGETLSVKAMEYLGMEIPVIVSRTTAANHYFDETIVSFFTPGNSDELKVKMVELYKNKKLRETLSKNSQKFNKKYNWTNFEKKYFEIIDIMLGKPV